MNDLRPQTLGDFTGQTQLVSDLRVLLGAAKKRGKNPDHILLSGPPGLGKTTLAVIVANELGMPLTATSGPAIVRPGDLLALLSSLTRPSVVFVDEIHALERKTEELLYTAMEDGYVDMILGDGQNARSVRITLQPFTLIGATTKMGSLSGPLRDRFGFHGRLVPYSDEELTDIVERAAKILDVSVSRTAAKLIAERSQGTPRIANRWLRRVRDWVELHELQEIDTRSAKAALTQFGIDELGLDQLGRDILQTVAAHFGGGPVGLNTLAASVGESDVTIETVYEPHLMRQGLLARTPRGRVITDSGWRHLGLTPPASASAPTLFPGDPAA